MLPLARPRDAKLTESANWSNEMPDLSRGTPEFKQIEDAVQQACARWKETARAYPDSARYAELDIEKHQKILRDWESVPDYAKQGLYFWQLRLRQMPSKLTVNCDAAEQALQSLCRLCDEYDIQGTMIERVEKLREYMGELIDALG